MLEALGSRRLRTSHGYVVQHLLSGPKTVGQLARLLGITQQGASKLVREMGPLLDDVDSDDARVRRVQLSKRGWATVEAARAARKRIHARLRRRLGLERIDAARVVLFEAIRELGGLEAIQRRRVRPR